MQIQIDPASSAPIYIQVVNQVKYLVASGRLSPGEEVPAIRTLAEQLVINPNTVARAYLELERAGVVVKRPGSGTFVAESPPAIARHQRQKILSARVDGLLTEARQLGVELDDVVELLRARHEKMTAPGPMKLPSTSSADALVSVTALSRRFGSRQALDEVTLHVPRGCVFGLVGENGAGKTTLIKHLLGLLKAETGTVRIFGRDPVGDPVGVLGRIGYLSEYRDLPAWMRVEELLNYTRAFYPGWDPQYAESLRAQFGLDPAQRVKSLSQGQQAKAGLLLALAFRPELLLLDEPSSGLDPVVRRDILEAIIRTVAEEGRTVLFSSHLLDEVERVSDQIAMIRDGRIVLCGRLDDIKQSHRRFVIRFETPPGSAPQFAQALALRGAGREWTVLGNGERLRLLADIEAQGAVVVSEQIPSLDEIFVAQAAHKTNRAPLISVG